MFNDIDNDLKDSMDLSNAAEGELMYEGTAVSGHNLLFDVSINLKKSFQKGKSLYFLLLWNPSKVDVKCNAEMQY